jgi:hypothetical protein
MLEVAWKLVIGIAQMELCSRGYDALAVALEIVSDAVSYR